MTRLRLSDSTRLVAWTYETKGDVGSGDDCADTSGSSRVRRDVALQTAVGRSRALTSASTLSRWENPSDRAQAWRLHKVLVEQFIGSFEHPPRKLVLDFHATDDRVHGRQEGRFFLGYYDHYCFLPLLFVQHSG